MIIVTNETELQNAINGSEAEIQIANDIEITTLKLLPRSLLIRSIPDRNFKLIKSVDTNESIFQVENESTLTLSNITLDGNKENRNQNADDSTLIYVNNGSLVLGENAVLQNNVCEDQGGAIYIHKYIPNGSFKMTDNAIIRHCNAGIGGAIYADLSDLYTFYIDGNSMIIDNEATSNGGGIWINVNKSTPTNILSGNVTIARNKAIRGGGMYIEERTFEAIHLMEGATISENTAAIGGGIYSSYATFTLRNVMMENNIAESQGGAIYHSALLNNKPSTIEQTLISSNKVSQGDGGAIYLENEYTELEFRLNIRDTEISMNQASNHGGAIYNKIATVYLDEGSSIHDNMASIGGALYNE